MNSEAGFNEGVRSFAGARAEGLVVRHGTGRNAVAHCVRTLMERTGAPTALLVNSSFLYLTVFSVLTQGGWRVPQDVSLLSRDADTFLSYLDPQPACYVEDPHLFARKLARITAKLLREFPAPPPQVQLMPRFVKGGSIAAPRGAGAAAGPPVGSKLEPA
jgi:DNA-binding LacI/PurR family transcriptional regulator